MSDDCDDIERRTSRGEPQHGDREEPTYDEGGARDAILIPMHLDRRQRKSSKQNEQQRTLTEEPVAGEWRGCG